MAHGVRGIDPDDFEGLVARARSYPFEWHPGSFVHVDGRCLPVRWRGDDSPLAAGRCVMGRAIVEDEDSGMGLPAKVWGRPLVSALDTLGCPPGSYALGDERTPVLGYGSNASPQQLARKFFDFPGPRGVLLNQRCTLHDFDSVYSALMSGYGSIPADLQHSPGTQLHCFVTWLDAEQMARMDETEGGYYLAELEGVHLELEDGNVLNKISAYLATAGQLSNLHDDSAEEDGGEHRHNFAVAEVPAEGRVFPSLRQHEAMELVRKKTHAHGLRGPAAHVDEFVLQNIKCADTRVARVRALAAAASKFAYPRHTISKRC